MSHAATHVAANSQKKCDNITSNSFCHPKHALLYCLNSKGRGSLRANPSCSMCGGAGGMCEGEDADGAVLPSALLFGGG